MRVRSRPLQEPVIASHPPDLVRAVATLRRGTVFLRAGLGMPHSDGRAAAIPPSDSKVIGNGLREIDLFLSLLIDAIAAALPLADDRRAALARLRNTARKLATIRQAMALASPDDAALRAIGRSRACLFHTAGTVRSAGPRSGPTHGWARPDDYETDRATVPLAVGSRLSVSPMDLHRIGMFYDRIATDLLAALDIGSGID